MTDFHRITKLALLRLLATVAVAALLLLLERRCGFPYPPASAEAAQPQPTETHDGVQRQ